ncbi:M3 family metallopeptidase [Homoserinibacter sp. GY 40078]|uniref:M3 family metallopeptidase n=1 Tax=Homoserinibacter sp. GY 40078 TaxID=2603275 RepID=UPI0011C87D95|nr:M3 family metallopeptidase [Homoserinibacter sp. GY 40078]TXK19709.1 M3 family metallopeptidase [Homoserinibacter sp. GY 40078]
MTNPFLAESKLPYLLPDFAAVRDEHYLPAFERGMSEQLAEIAEITADPAPATFGNTLEPLERSGAVLDRVATVFYTLASSDTTPHIQELEEDLAPRLAAHHDAIVLDAELFARIDAVHRAHEDGTAPLDAEQSYLVHRRRTEMVLAGAALDEGQKERLRALNQTISTLTTRFEKNLLNDTNELAVHITDEAELAGLAAGELSAAREAASARDLDGWLVTLVLPTGHPWLGALEDPATRARIMAASRARGIHGGDFDNTGLVLELVRARAERARLLGFRDHASVVTADETAGSPAAVAELLTRLAPAAARNAAAERAELEALHGSAIGAADWAHAADAVRRERFAIDTAALRPWFEAERVLRDGVFFAAERLYGLRFAERDDLRGWNDEVRVFEVSDDDGAVGLYLLDLYTRDSKRGGAWMNSLVERSELLGTPSVVTNNLNVPRPAAGEPTLLTLDEVETLFHEFGHALHGLFAQARFPSLAGTNVFRDFVEFPSQVNEMWAMWPEVLADYARHHETGEPLDPAISERLREAERFGQGFSTSEYLQAALLDQAWHALDVEEAADVTDAAAFEARALADAGLASDAIPPRYATTYFAHVFSGGYDAGYYSYIWSEVLDADTVEWFRENGGMTRENGERFRRRLLQTASARDPLEAFRDFRGRDAALEPLLERRGLA